MNQISAAQRDAMAGRTVVVTGGTDGIGWHTAAGLAARGATVVVTGRDRAKGERAVGALRAAAGSNAGPVELHVADLSTSAGVSALAAGLVAAHPAIDVLVNNVGALSMHRRVTGDGIETSLAVNALAPYLLTKLLEPALRAAVTVSGEARVVDVTGGRPGRIHLDDVQNSRDYQPLRAYSHAKTVMMALARRQAQALVGTGITVNVVYPGVANTPMSRGMTADAFPGPLRLAAPVMRLVLGRAEPERASRSSIALASDPRYRGQTGGYWSSRIRPARWPVDVLDDDLADRLAVVADNLTRRARVTAPPAHP